MVLLDFCVPVRVRARGRSICGLVGTGVFFGSLLDADALALVSDDSALALCFSAWFPSPQTSRHSPSVFRSGVPQLSHPTYLEGVALSGLRRPE